MSRIALAATLIVLLTGCSPSTATSPALSSVPPSPPIASGSPASGATASAAPASSRLAGMGRRLEAGQYIYEDAFPHVTFELPQDWYLDEAMPRHFGIRPKDMAEEDTFIVWFDMHLASRDPSCPEQPRAGVGHAASDLEGSFHANPGVVSTRSVLAGVGGLPGHSFDVWLAPTWKGTCPFSDGHPTVPLFVDDDVDGEPAFWGVGGKERIRMYVLDDQHGSNVLITFDSASGTTVDAIEAAAMPVLKTFHFDIGS